MVRLYSESTSELQLDIDFLTENSQIWPCIRFKTEYILHVFMEYEELNCPFFPYIPRGTGRLLENLIMIIILFPLS